MFDKLFRSDSSSEKFLDVEKIKKQGLMLMIDIERRLRFWGAVNQSNFKDGIFRREGHVYENV